MSEQYTLRMQGSHKLAEDHVQWHGSISAEFILPHSFQDFMLVKFWTVVLPCNNTIWNSTGVQKLKEHGHLAQTAR
jgi:hypothetical protein